MKSRQEINYVTVCAQNSYGASDKKYKELEKAGFNLKMRRLRQLRRRIERSGQEKTQREKPNKSTEWTETER